MQVFECQMCGQCCEGKGGIPLSDEDISRLAAWLSLSEKEFMTRFCELSGGKQKIISGKDGFCVFFNTDHGCGVHEAKPDICRAWPFFRGNLVDPVSFAMAREYCPGISRPVEFDEFVVYGAAWLTCNRLNKPTAAGNALRYSVPGSPD